MKDIYGPDAEYFLSRAKELHESQKEKGDVTYLVKPFLWNPEYGFVNNPFQEGGSMFHPVAPDAEKWDWHWSLRTPHIKMGMWTSSGRFPDHADRLEGFDAWVKGHPHMPENHWDLGQLIANGDFKKLHRALNTLAEAQRKLDRIFPGRRSRMFGYCKPLTSVPFERLPRNIVKLPIAA
jgi:hypothetical protein